MWLVYRVSNVYEWLIICMTSMSGHSTVFVNGFWVVASNMSHFSNNYLKLNYALWYTERLKATGWLWFSITLIYDAQQTLQEKRIVATVHGHMLYIIYIHLTMFYIAIWLFLLLVIHCIMDKISEIDHFGEILIRIKFSQVVNQL